MSKQPELRERDPRSHCHDLERASAPAPRLSAHQIAEALRGGFCPTDYAFDRFLPYELRVVSRQYWTPLLVARRVADWLDDLGVRTVVDIGSGAGKFCIAAALAGDCYFTGLEQRSGLVAVARTMAGLYGVDDRVHFIEGSLGEITAPVADAYYLYNPFGENLYGELDHLDETVELSAPRYARDVALTEDLLERAPLDTCVLTYNGFGGSMPHDYEQIRVDRHLPSVLRMWRKIRHVRSTAESRPILHGKRSGPSSS